MVEKEEAGSTRPQYEKESGHFQKSADTNHARLTDDDNIDLAEAILTIWKDRKLLIITIGVFLVVGLLVALCRQEEYTSEVKLMPEARQSSSLGGLGGLARQFGVGSLSRGAEMEGIPANYYPDITQSLPFMMQLLEYETYVSETNENMSLFRYFTESRTPSLFSVVKKYTISLPFTILEWLRGEADAGIDFEVSDIGPEKSSRIVLLSKKEWEVINGLQDRISVEIARETGVVTVKVKMPDPYIAADVSDQVIQFLTEYIEEYRTEKARTDVEFVEERHEEARRRFEHSQERLAQFRDESRGQLTEMARTQEQRLQSEYDLSFNMYNAMSERLEEARIKLQEEKPVVKVLEPAAIPDKRSAPRRTVIMIISLFLGSIAGVGIIYGKQYIRKFRESLAQKSSA